MNKFKRLQKGFTLIELMIVVAIIAILSAIALPSYTEYIKRSNRTAAQSQMMDIANRQQQFLFADRVYADTTKIVSSGFALPPELSSKYTFKVEADNSAEPPIYTITFKPVKGSSQEKDVELTLNHQGVKTPAGKW